MNPIATKRPGVYSQYAVTSLYAQPVSQRAAALVGVLPGLDPASPVLCTRYSQAAPLLAESPAALAACAVLFGRGVGQVYLVHAGESPEEYTAAFASLENLAEIGCVICDNSQEEILAALNTSCQTASQGRRERLGLCGMDDSSQAKTLAGTLNSERMLLCCPAPALSGEACPLLGAAALAGEILCESDPSASFSGRDIPLPEGLSRELSSQEVEDLLGAGVTPLETLGGSVQIIRCITTRTQTDGKTDLSFLPVNTILIIDHVMETVRSALKSRLSGMKNTTQTRESIASQVTVELQQLLEQEILESYQAPRVYVHSEDPSVLVVELAFTVAHAANQILISASIQV